MFGPTNTLHAICGVSGRGEAGRISVGAMAARLLFGGGHCLDDDGVEAVPARRVQSRCRQQLGCPPFRTRFAPPSCHQGRQQQQGEQVGQHQAATGRQHP